MTMIKPFAFNSLRARLTVFLIAPVVVILLAAGIWGFVYARNTLLRQWTERVMLQLQEGAREIETGFSWPVELMKMFAQSGASGPSTDLLEALVQKLKTLPGVVKVNLNWHASRVEHQLDMHTREPGKGRFMRFHRGSFTRISPPVIDETTGKQTISINMVLMDAYETPVGNLEIVLLFEALVSEITADPWWQNATACIADRATGEMVLTSGLMQGRTHLGQNGDSLEQSVAAAIRDRTAGTVWEQGHPPERIAGFHSLDTFPWALVVVADGKTILAPIINFRNGFIIGAAVLLLTAFGIIRLNVDRISNIVIQLSRRARAIAGGDYRDKIEVAGRDEIGQLTESFNAMIDGLKERDAIRNTFGMYVNPEFARTLLRRPAAGRLGGQRREVAILMADIRDFTPMTENLSPEQTIDVLNRYFAAIIPLIQQNRGIIVDFVGDGILAFFEPVDEELAVTTRRSVSCAFAMHSAMDILNRQMVQHDLPEIAMGIGINCGPVVVGNIGSETRKKYGIVGSAVNITQRIQGQSDAGEVVISESVYRHVRSEVTVKRNFSATLKGVTPAVRLIAVSPDKPTDNRS